MKLFKTLVLTAFLTIGFIVPSCVKDCDCPPESKLEFFDIEGMKTSNFRQEPTGQVISLSENDSVRLDRYFFELNFDVSYFGFSEPSFWQDISLMNSALACRCAEPGARGSKEKIGTLAITTLKDFDTSHPAGSDINDLVNIESNFVNVDLTEYLQSNTSAIHSPFLSFSLKSAPVLNDTFQTKINLKLDNGEEYEVVTGKVIVFEQ